MSAPGAARRQDASAGRAATAATLAANTPRPSLLDRCCSADPTSAGQAAGRAQTTKQQQLQQQHTAAAAAAQQPQNGEAGKQAVPAWAPVSAVSRSSTLQSVGTPSSAERTLPKREQGESSSRSDSPDCDCSRQDTAYGTGGQGCDAVAPLAALLRNVLHQDGQRRLLEEDFTIGPVIGEGAYATVRLVEDWRSGELYACKTIPKARLLCQEDVADVVREVDILNLLLGHPNITALRGTYEDRHALHLVQDYCSGGELFARIVRKGSFCEAEAAACFRQMVEVVHHCHAAGVIHRDIKLENFLLSSDEEPCVLKACDFGLATYFKPGQRFSERVGTCWYLAPEVLARDHGPEVDFWSLGVVLYVLLSGRPPFRGASDTEIFEEIQAGYVDLDDEPWPKISAEAKDIVRRLLTTDPAARATTEELLRHPWLAAQGVASDHPLDSVVITRMRAFAGANKLKKAAVMAASKQISLDQMEGLKQLFETFDSNGDGVISLAELRAGLERLDSGITERELQQVWSETDVDSSGGLDYHEFLAATASMGLLLQDEVLMRAFRELDTDGSGYLNVEEVAAAIGGMGALQLTEARALVAQFDANGDGVIDYAEFIAMLRGTDPKEQGQVPLRYKRTLTALRHYQK